MKKLTIQFIIFFGLVLIMAFTRSSHFGTAIHLPDASLAIFMIAGFILWRNAAMAFLFFALLLLEAGAVDYYAITFRNVSDYCVSPAYWFLIPTYATMWMGGRWISLHQQQGWRGYAMFGGISLFATSVAFLISNGSFYLFSGRFADISIAEYAARVAKYYTPYLGNTLSYLALAAAIHAGFTYLNKSSAQTQQH